MRNTTPFILCLLLVVAVLAFAAPAEAAKCACSSVCCPGSHSPGLTCLTECCTVTGWTTCGGYGMPGCEESVAAGADLEALLLPAQSVEAPSPDAEVVELAPFVRDE